MPPPRRPASRLVRNCLYLVVVPLLVVGLVLIWEGNSGRSLASVVERSGSSVWVASSNNTSGIPVGDEADEDPESDALEESAAQQSARTNAGGAEYNGSETDELKLWKLTHSMMYWAHSNPVPKPSHSDLFPPSSEVRYITWEQDFAGMNNVRYQVEVLVVMAHLFRRTLVLPDHLAFAMDHLGDYGEHTIGDFFDFHDLSTWVSVITMQQYLDARGVEQDSLLRRDTHALREYLRGPEHGGTVFPKWDANSEVMPVPDEDAVQGRTDPDWKTFKERAAAVVTYTEEYRQARTMHFMMEGNDYRLFGNCAGFWYWPSQAWQDYYMGGMRDHFHFNRDIVANASRVVHHLRQRFDVGAFNALHDRVDDFKDQFPYYYIGEDELALHMQMVLGETELPLYVAAKSVNETRYAPLRAAFKHVVFLEDVLGEVLPGVPPIYLGPIEQMVCSVAARFVGTFGSTFSGYVHRLRGYHHPGLVPDKGVFYTNFPFPDPAEYADSIANNEPWANIRWWDTGGGPVFRDAMWAREFSLTWDFSKSEVSRSHTVFEPARRRRRHRTR